MQPGPRPKPVELRVLHGAARRIALESVPKPRRKLPRCPDFLTGEAALCWKRTASDLYDAGLLTTVDRDALAAYCVAFARWRQAEEYVKKKGLVIFTSLKTDEDGNVIGGNNPIQNPYLAIANKAFDQMCKLMAEFGMTPSSRTRVKIEPQPAQRKPRPQQAQERASDDDPRKALTA